MTLAREAGSRLYWPSGFSTTALGAGSNSREKLGPELRPWNRDAPTVLQAPQANGASGSAPTSVIEWLDFKEPELEGYAAPDAGYPDPTSMHRSSVPPPLEAPPAPWSKVSRRASLLASPTLPGDQAPVRRDSHWKLVQARKGRLPSIGPQSKQTSGRSHSICKVKTEMSEKARDLIFEAFKQKWVYGSLDRGQFQHIVEHMEYFTFAEGVNVIEQGEPAKYFFVVFEGTLEVSMLSQGTQVVSKLSQGESFGEISLLCNHSHNAAVVARSPSGLWGVEGRVFRQILQGNSREVRSFLDAVKLFHGLDTKLKDRISEVIETQVFAANEKVVAEGELATSLYFVKKGELRILVGAKVSSTGEISGGSEIEVISTGECVGEKPFLYNEARRDTVQAAVESELCFIRAEDLKGVLGGDRIPELLLKNLLLRGIKKSTFFARLGSTQQLAVVRACEIRTMADQHGLEGAQWMLLLDGQLISTRAGRAVFVRGQWFGDDSLIAGCCQKEGNIGVNITEFGPFAPVAGSGCKVALLTSQRLGQVMKELGLLASSAPEQVLDYARRRQVAKTVYLFRHLSDWQIDALVKGMVLQRYAHGTKVITQGETGSVFFILSEGELVVKKNNEKIRTLGKSACFGERALLFDEFRSATVKVSSSSAEIWGVEKATFKSIVRGQMEEQLMHRIKLQDTTMKLKDLQPIRVIGMGAFGVVRLVEHTTTGVRYALKQISKDDAGKVPACIQQECDLLAENDHPFIMQLVKRFDSKSNVYILTELIPGGELFAAMHERETLFKHGEVQFYVGSLVLALEGLHERHILYRDLKPENVLLDHHGYPKLIDFGLSKKLEDGRRTYTAVGTPHYMAPEIIEGKGYGGEIDQWALGIICYELVCGELPYGTERLEDTMEICKAVICGKLVFPRWVQNAKGKMLIRGLLARKRQDRIGADVHHGYEHIKTHGFFDLTPEHLASSLNGHDVRSGQGNDQTLFDLLMGRALEAPVIPFLLPECDGPDGPDGGDGFTLVARRGTEESRLSVTAQTTRVDFDEPSRTGPVNSSGTVSMSALVGAATNAVCPPGQCQFGDDWKAAALVERIQLTHDVFLLTFRLPDEARSLGLSTCACILAKRDNTDDPANPIVRPYTPISTNALIGRFQLVIKVYPGGAMTQYMKAMEVRASLHFKHIEKNVKTQYPFGKTSITMLVGGSGINPMMQALHPLLGTVGDTTKVTLIFGNKEEKDILCKDLLDKWAADSGGRFSVVNVLSRCAADTTWQGPKGHIDRKLIEANSAPTASNYVVVCGPPPMYNALCGPREEQELTGLLKDMGYRADQVYKF